MCVHAVLAFVAIALSCMIIEQFIQLSVTDISDFLKVNIM